MLYFKDFLILHKVISLLPPIPQLPPQIKHASGKEGAGAEKFQPERFYAPVGDLSVLVKELKGEKFCGGSNIPWKQKGGKRSFF